MKKHLIESNISGCLLIRASWEDLMRGHFEINTSLVSMNYPIRIDLSEIKEQYEIKLAQLGEPSNAEIERSIGK